MPGLCAPNTPQEQLVMDDITRAYEQLVEVEKKSPTNSAQIIAAIEDMAYQRTAAGHAYYEINREIIPRDSHNLRSTKRVREALLRWVKAMRSQETGEFYIDMFCSGGTQRLWIMGIILYFKDRIQKLLTRTGLFTDVFAAEKSAAAGTLVDRRAMVSTSDVTKIFEQVEKVDVERLCRSPDFKEAIDQVPRLMRCSHIAVEMAKLVAGDRTIDNSKTATPQQDPSVVLGQQMSSSSWMHLLFVMMRAAQYMHDTRAVARASMTGGGSAVTAAAASALEGLPSEKNIQNMFTAISDILKQVFGENNTPVMMLLSLRFTRSSCTTYFSPAVFTETVMAATTSQETALQTATPGHFDLDVARSLEQIRDDKLWHFLANEAPEFIQKNRTLMESGVADEWLTTVLLRQLFLYRYPDGSDGAPKTASQAGGAFYAEKDEKELVDEDKHTHLFLFHCLVVVLRPLFFQLLTVSPPKQQLPSESVADSATGVHVDAEAEALLADHAEHIAAAREAILSIARTADLIDIPASKQVVRDWEMLEVGVQPRSRCAIGKMSFQKAVEVVLGDVMRSALVWMTQPVSNWTRLLTSPAAANAKNIMPDEFELPLFRFLMRTERTYYALTDAAASAGGGGNDGAAPAETQPLPDSLQACKSHYSSAVAKALKYFYPINAPHVLVVPLVDSIHNYLLDQEHLSGVSAGGGARPPPRPGMKKMPPPPPGAKQPPPAAPSGAPTQRPAGAAGAAAAASARQFLTLKSTEDLHTALRLVGCIDADIFFQKYRDMLQVRFMCCPPPVVVPRDEDFDAKRIATEQVATSYMRFIFSDNGVDLRTVREVCGTFKRTANAVDGVKMVVSALPWNLWNFSTELTEASKPLSAEQRAQTTSTTAAVTPDSPLPFPSDLSRAMDTYVGQVEASMSGRQLRWYGSVERSFTTFELRYPRDEGRATTIHGTLQLEQLFLAISQYGRQGVPLDTLAARAGLSRVELDRVLGACIHRDRLLVVQSDAVSLNYEFQRPETNKMGVFVHWPRPQRFCARINTAEQEKIYKDRVEKGRMEVIRIMKSLRTSTFKHVEETAREKLAHRFTLSTRLFKDIINRLVEDKFIERGNTEDELNYLA